MKKTLYNTLKNYYKSNIYPFHMPGHKNSNLINKNELINMDFTEIDGLDYLHSPTGIIDTAQKRASKIYSSLKTFFLINGSTVGILASILALTKKGDKILMARNCHKSVYHAVILNELEPIYIETQLLKSYSISGGISKEDVKALLNKNKTVKIVIITSPTYEGIVSDVQTIANEVHKYNIPLIVDEAHGAHFGFCSDFPQSSNRLGADVVIHSMHKTLSALTQTALLHINSNRISHENIANYLGMLQTSSPSYILMASIDNCVELLENRGQELFKEYVHNLNAFRTQIRNKLCKINLLSKQVINQFNIYDIDIGKLVFNFINTNILANEACDILHNKYKLQMELCNKDYFIAMTSISDTKKAYDDLLQAMINIDSKLKKSEIKTDNLISRIKTKMVMTPSQAKESQYTAILLKESMGCIAKDFIIPYPPGIPIIVPGEIITKEIIDYIEYLNNQGMLIMGFCNNLLQTINIIKE